MASAKVNRIAEPYSSFSGPIAAHTIFPGGHNRDARDVGGQAAATLGPGGQCRAVVPDRHRDYVVDVVEADHRSAVGMREHVFDEHGDDELGDRDQLGPRPFP
jgi:hypothetical protein